MADRFYRLVTFIISVCPLPLRKLFLKHAMATFTPGTTFTVTAYIKFRHHDLAQIKSLTRDQRDLLFHARSISMDDWDSSLLILLLTELFEHQVRPLTGHLKLIREYRNELLHIPKTETLTKEQFDNIWEGLRDSTIAVAERAGDSKFKKEIKDLIKQVLVNNMPDLGDVLRKWYNERIVCLENDVKVLHEQLLDVSTGTDETTKILKSTSWDKHTRATGVTSRRWKTVNSKVKHMQETFETIMENYKEVDSCNPSLVNDVLAQLERKHHSVVSGHCEEAYINVAVTAIAKMHLPIERCLIIDIPADWRYVVRMDTDLVIFWHPFGKGYFEMEKAELMSDLQDSILHPVIQDVKRHNVNIVIVTEHTILNKYKSYFDHKIVADPIEVKTPEDTAVDLTKGCTKFYNRYPQNDQYSDFVAKSICLMRFLKETMICPLQSNLRQAKDILKTNKTLVIVGTQRSGKTSLALSLLQAYEESHCLLLTEPEEVMFVRLGETCVVMIDDFTGKYLFDPPRVERWFRKFDVLLAAVKNRQLNVVITSEEAGFSRCCLDFPGHPMLQHVMKMGTDQGCFPSSPGPSNTRSDVRASFTLARCEKPDGYLRGNKIQDICNIGNGQMLVGNLRNVSLLNSDLSLCKEFNNVNCHMKIILSTCSSAFCTIGSKIYLFKINGRECSLISIIPLENRALSASIFKNKIYVFDRTGKLSIFSTSLQFECMFDIPLVNKDDILSTHVGIVALDDMIFLLKKFVYCIYFRTNTIRYLSEEKFVPLSICRCDECSIFILGKSKLLNKTQLSVYQLNSKMEMHCKIALRDMIDDQDFLSDSQIVFDTDKSRLIIFNNGSCSDIVYIRRY